jgi:Ca2+:H+ antiporter
MSTAVNNPAGRLVAEFRHSSTVNKVFIGMLVFVPLAVLADLLGFTPLLTFVISALAVVPLAKLMSDSTEALSEHAGSAVGALLNATFGNAVELIIAILALFQGLTEVVKASITGSIIGNVLLVLGFSMFLGGLPRKYQFFNRVSASASASQLTLAAIALIVPAVFTTTLGNSLSQTQKNDLLEDLSLIVGGILIACYIGQLIFFLRTHADLSNDEGEDSAPPEQNTPDNVLTTAKQSAEVKKEPEEAVWGVKRSLITLLVATVVVGFVSEILVGSIEPVTKDLGLSELFVGVILLAIIGNAAEYVAAITAAMKNEMNLSVNIAIGSTLQLAFFVVPVLVFVSLFIGHPLTLRFEEFELICILVAVLIVGRVANDGESNWFEGLQLIGAYLIVGVAFFLHP